MRIRAIISLRTSHSTFCRRSTKPAGQQALNTELILLQRAERAIRSGEPELALSLLHELDQQQPNTRLGEERNAARLMARCARGDTAAHAEAEQFLRERRASVYSDRVRELCGLKR